MRAKYELLSGNDLLGFEFETSSFSQLAGMHELKKWLHQREKFFHQVKGSPALDRPKGISVNEHDDGTSQRILGSMLTWMAEKVAALQQWAQGRTVSVD